MRLFFGVPIDESGQNSIKSIISELNEGCSDRYTLLSNLHITLTFIGEVEPKVSYMLADIGDKAFSNVERFGIRTGDVASFKDGKITYLGIQPSDALNSIHYSLNTLLDEAGMVYTDNDAYTPHITLRRGRRERLDRQITPIDIDVTRICLFESKRVDDILRYIPLKTWELRGKNGD